MPVDTPEMLAGEMCVLRLPAHHHPPQFMRTDPLLPGSAAVLKISITDRSFQLVLSVLNSVIVK